MNDAGDAAPVGPTALVAKPVKQSQPLDVPVTPRERIAFIDVLRGFALFGILLVNMAYFRLPGEAIINDVRLYDGPLDRLADGAVQILAEGKFFTLFSFLFGYGMALQLRRASDPGRGFRNRYLKRCLWLALFGLLHATLIWDGDILFTYGLLGMVLLLVRFQPAWLVTYWSVLAYAYAICGTGFGAVVIYALEDMGLERVLHDYEPHQQMLAVLTSVADQIQLYADGPWIEVALHRTAEWVNLMLPISVFMMWPNVFAVFLLGLLASRFRLLEQPARFRGVHRWLWAIGVLIGIPGNLLLWQFYYAQPRPSLAMLALVLSPVIAPALTALYVVMLISLWRWSWAQMRLAVLAPVGRMALTNYLMQSLVCGFLFYSHGLGMIGGVTPLDGLALVVVIFLTQILISHAWLRYFNFGPLEWIWRSLTYGRWQTLWRSAQPASA